MQKNGLEAGMPAAAILPLRIGKTRPSPSGASENESAPQALASPEPQHVGSHRGGRVDDASDERCELGDEAERILGETADRTGRVDQQAVLAVIHNVRCSLPLPNGYKLIVAECILIQAKN